MRHAITTKPAGFTLVEIMIVVAIIGVLLAIAIPGWVHARDESSRKACQENLFQLDGAKEQWAMEKKKSSDSVPPGWSDLIGTSLYLRRTPECPYHGVYSINIIGQRPTCTQASDGHFLPGTI